MSRNDAPPPLRVLYLHHIGPFGGASRSLLDLVLAFPKGAVEAGFQNPPASCFTR